MTKYKSVCIKSIIFLLFVVSIHLVVADEVKIGIVLMHGKGGSPSGLVRELAEKLQTQGFMLENLEMPWSARRQYDVSVDIADAEVVAAVTGLRNRGAKKVFVAGHSQGGVYAMHFGSIFRVDGIIAIAPGGDVASELFVTTLGNWVNQAKEMQQQGKGVARADFYDYEGKKGKIQINTTADIYISWFDPDGAMNLKRSISSFNPATPVLWLIPVNDYPGLRKVTHPLYDSLPANPLTKRIEPNSDHRGAPTASFDDIVSWIKSISTSK